MRLIERKDDGSFVLTPFFVRDGDIPEYAVLSHTWLSEGEEVSFKDMNETPAETKPKGYEKIRFCGKQAAKDGLRFFWVDTCCIDQSNHAELQESITRMYQWFRRATRCYVFLADVSATNDDLNGPTTSDQWLTAFRKCRWFTRGWTLQELLAPKFVGFYSAEGTRLGDKRSLLQDIHEITQIPEAALQSKPLSQFSIAERLSWAQNRDTTRKEDKAYCLVGLFGIFLTFRYGEGNNAYARLLKAIEKKHTEKGKLDYTLDVLPTAPSAAFNSRENEYGQTCYDDTRTELLRDIMSWTAGSDDRCIFWLKGIAGTGKSTIARTIASVFDAQGNLGGSFFFSKNGGDANHADKLITTFASQLATKFPSLRNHICEAIVERRDISQKALRVQWHHLIMGPLSKLDRETSPSNIVIVVDALDECDSDRDIRIILSLFRLANALRNIRLRIFVTSRPDIPIRRGFLEVPKEERQDIILQDIPTELIERDLKIFFQQRFNSIREERGLPLEWPGDQKISSLVQRSGGLFIWAATACRYVSDGKHFADKRISKLIGHHGSAYLKPEKQLDQIYMTVLIESFHVGFDEDERNGLGIIFRKVLGSIVTLFQPLSTNALTKLLDVKKEQIAETLDALHTILNIPEEDDRPIRLHHPTFRDFLLDARRCSCPDFWIDEEKVHTALAEACVSTMNKMLQRNLCNIQDPGVLIDDIHRSRIERSLPPELQYACIYWAEHCRRGGMRLQDNDIVHCFLQEHFLHWLEVISLIGRSKEMLAIMRIYQSLLSPDSNSNQIAFIKDSRRFMYAFQSTIEKRPLQIYCAALVFIRPSNELRHHFWGQIHPRLKKVRVVEATAPDMKDEYNYVNDLSFTPDSLNVASGSLDDWVRIWDVASKAALAKEGSWDQTDKISSVAISSDGTMLASGSDDSTAVILDMDSRSPRFTLKGHTRWVNSVKFSPDDKMLASGSMDETIRIWDVASGEELKLLNDISTGVNDIAFSPDGSLVALGTIDQMVRLWDFRKGDIRMILDGHSGPVNSVEYSPHGNRIVSGSDDTTIKIWDATKGTEVKTLQGHEQAVWATIFSPDAERIASGSADMTVRLWDSTTGDLLFTLKGHTSGINAVAYSPDGRLLASGSFNDEVQLWHAKDGESRGKLADFQDDAATPSASGNTFDANMIDSDAFKGHSDAVTYVAFSSDGQTVASGSNDTTIKLWTKEGSPLCTFEGHTDRVDHVAFSPNSRVVASASADMTVKLWDTAAGKLLYDLRGHTGPVCLTRFSSDGRALASCSKDKTVRLWDATNGTTLSTFEGHSDAVNAIVFSPDDQYIASCSQDMTVCLWDIPAGDTALRILRGHEKSVNSITFSSDGRLLASCSADATIRIWDKAGAVISVLDGHDLSVTSVAFSADMSRLVSYSNDRTVRVWNLDTNSVTNVLHVGVHIRDLAFSASGNCIETDRGVLEISTPANDSTFRRASTLFVTEHWVIHKEDSALWIPDEYVANDIATWNETTVLGHSSGALSFIGF